MKEIIHEKFDDGIVRRVIDFTMDIEKIPDPNGDRVRVTKNGRFLPYKNWQVQLRHPSLQREERRNRGCGSGTMAHPFGIPDTIAAFANRPGHAS